MNNEKLASPEENLNAEQTTFIIETIQDMLKKGEIQRSPYAEPQSLFDPTVTELAHLMDQLHATTATLERVYDHQGRDALTGVDPQGNHWIIYARSALERGDVTLDARRCTQRDLKTENASLQISAHLSNSNAKAEIVIQDNTLERCNRGTFEYTHG